MPIEQVKDMLFFFRYPIGMIHIQLWRRTAQAECVFVIQRYLPVSLRLPDKQGQPGIKDKYFESSGLRSIHGTT